MNLILIALVAVANGYTVSDSCWPTISEGTVSDRTDRLTADDWGLPNQYNVRSYRALIETKNTGTRLPLSIQCSLHYILPWYATVKAPYATCLAILNGVQVGGADSMKLSDVDGIPDQLSDYYFLDSVGVDPETRKSYRGIGSSLVAATLDLASECGFQGIYLRSAVTATGFYDKLGFQSDPDLGLLRMANKDLLPALSQKTHLQHE